MEETLINLAYDALAILIPALVTMVLELLRRKLCVEKLNKVQKELEANQQIALFAVKAVEQAWKGELRGPEKVAKAAEIISLEAKKRGIRVSSEQIETLIEWAVRTIKDEFGEQWAGVLQESGGHAT